MRNKIEIDEKSGFCFGVVNAIEKAEEELKKGGILYCLGDIVHNSLEVERLAKLGLRTINHEEFAKLKNVKVLLRAHGEPPSTYRIAKENNIEIIDASCPVVLRLQKKIHNRYNKEIEKQTQIVIYGKNGHAEVNGLIGQTNSNAIVIEKKEDLDLLDYNKNICLFSQTTKSLEGFREIIELIKKRISDDATFEYHDTICRQVSNRIPNIKEFAQKHDLIFFVAGKKSSNGKVLFAECKKYNSNSFFVSSPSEVDVSVIKENMSIGICGATSTPRWQMEEIEKLIADLNKKS
ncbi:4-hydroxy-3-methylbut-2-enyl diphosphate reductase [Dysgonomonas sp. PH5-45]|uniref:4-hydroxy-3-methylbut-2-enyl diphosphate reductase n=1 Tax=unclassified Dysgonomonas TaxID=2630389 RepID=UPI002476A64B|nr:MULTISPECIES: 4-hydroxy-3-methylbut-2-enyl diphosphate reductase [unclassified Dysgonomonas]MDH6355641.1 4-hydroxy-3-methylbut-2-enyl diphosphate reductase [Dysgonomonas sp. PH5-45]MDH6388538.1 4-hydroxy-3-methylbut-2-enyl diphosphate reductase [Dysgonomonas sp. PH5-37]